MSIRETTGADFQDLTNTDFVLLEFYTEDCIPCRMLETVFSDLEFELPYANIVKVNATEYPQISIDYNVMGYPTLVFIKNGRETHRHLGFMDLDSLKSIIAENLYE